MIVYVLTEPAQPLSLQFIPAIVLVSILTILSCQQNADDLTQSLSVTVSMISQNPLFKEHVLEIWVHVYVHDKDIHSTVTQQYQPPSDTCTRVRPSRGVVQGAG